MTTASKSKSHFLHFEVDGNGTLRMAGFEEPTTRAEIYENIGDAWAESPAKLMEAMEECRPLAWEVHSLYTDHRDVVVAPLEQARAAHAEAKSRRGKARDAAAIAALAAQVEALTQSFAALPEEPEQGVEAWLKSLSAEAWKTEVVPAVEAWLDAPPDWRWGEEDYIPACATAQGAAFEYFRDQMDPEDCELLGVQVVEGECPGSSYCAAELMIGVDEANAIAEEHGMEVRFGEG